MTIYQKTMKNSNVYLETKPHYDILDGLRGVAALLIVAYHLFENYFHGSPSQPINHGYLAVDFFFVLSGFVIGYAYDDRWDKMTTWQFFKRRFVRLHPMVVFGTFVGAALFYFGRCEGFPNIEETPLWLFGVAVLASLLMVPLPPSMDTRGWGETNPLNGPAWSLQWEYFANILYALIVRRLSNVVLALCVLVFAAATVTLCLNIDVFGFLEERSWAAYTVVGGWSLTPGQLQVGLTRLLYPFFCGLLISRLGRLVKVDGGFWWCSLAIVVLMAMPWMGLGTEGGSRWTNGVYEAVCVLVMFPLIVMVGAGSRITGKRTLAVNKFLGEISYPIYITHYPIVYMQMAWAERNADLPVEIHVTVCVLVYITAVAVAYAAYRLYDVPTREWLKNKLFNNKKRK